MRKNQHTGEQIVGILKELDAGLTTTELCRRHGFTLEMFGPWKVE